MLYYKHYTFSWINNQIAITKNITLSERKLSTGNQQCIYTNISFCPPKAQNTSLSSQKQCVLRKTVCPHINSLSAQKNTSLSAQKNTSLFIFLHISSCSFPQKKTSIRLFYLFVYLCRIFIYNLCIHVCFFVGGAAGAKVPFVQSLSPYICKNILIVY